MNLLLKYVPVPPRTIRGWDIMEGGSSFKEVGTSVSPEGQSTRKMSALETLHQMYMEKSSKVQELKTEIELVKHQLEKDIPDEREKGFKALSKKYDRLRTEYNALLPKKGEPGK
ncbi:uncharacterized protein LOC122088241 [Macadamia integrifolia]|uniref:uncharacterized protein LOC122088241 n=1 Tax=Macadamia integrifolia TaxID=60698 RepID=UPI001C4F7F19|nr:uncharacterized protein LOC122088241 [Macadamia integrifolia]